MIHLLAINDKAVKVDNPLDSNRQFLRLNIIDSLISNLDYNEKRQKESIKLFEISDIYKKNKITKPKQSNFYNYFWKKRP